MFIEDLKASPLVAIVRGVMPSEAADVAKALFDGGIRFMEVTMNSPSPGESIAEMKRALEGSGAHVGAGTVTTLRRLEDAAKAGAEFIISPDCNHQIIRETKRLGLVSMPGFFTPSEAFRALDAGADVLKCFPCAVLGPGFLKDLKAVLDAPVMAVGGIGMENMDKYLAVAEAVGIGSSLYKPGLKPEQLLERAKAFIKAAMACKESGNVR